MRKGKLVYLSADAAIGLEQIGKKYIERDFKRRGKRVSYNKACLYILQIFRIAEKIEKMTEEEDK